MISIERRNLAPSCIEFVGEGIVACHAFIAHSTVISAEKTKVGKGKLLSRIRDSFSSALDCSQLRVCLCTEHCTVGLPTGSTGTLLLPKISVSAVEEAAKSLSIRPLLAPIIASFPHTNVEEQLSTQITPSSASWPRAMNAFITIFCYSTSSSTVSNNSKKEELCIERFQGLSEHCVIGLPTDSPPKMLLLKMPVAAKAVVGQQRHRGFSLTLQRYDNHFITSYLCGRTAVRSDHPEVRQVTAVNAFATMVSYGTSSSISIRTEMNISSVQFPNTKIVRIEALHRLNSREEVAISKGKSQNELMVDIERALSRR
ncbi:hypothetical protein Aperf_G00000048051 [Anoplocephala perfoliata]